jgi:hypothetical protein
MNLVWKVLRDGLKLHMHDIDSNYQENFTKTLHRYRLWTLLERLLLGLLSIIGLLMTMGNRDVFLLIFAIWFSLGVCSMIGWSPAGFRMSEKMHDLRVAKSTKRIALIRFMYRDTEYERSRPRRTRGEETCQESTG